MSENLYLPPSTSVEVSPPLPRHPGQGSPYGGYHEVGVLSKVIAGILAVSVLGDVIYSLIDWTNLRVFSERSFDDESSFYLKVTRLSEWIDNVYLILWLVLAIIWCVWTSRVCKNAWLINSRDGATAIYRGRKSYSPVVSWALHFIPIAQFWIPFQAMAWICDASQKPLGLTMGKLVGAWWSFWIANLGVGVMTIILYSGAETSEELAAFYRVSLVLSPVPILSTVYGGLMVLRLSLIQRLRASDLGLR
ncbi:MAG: DUF4328 domain-containing protein [Akkermansiaceae bacterium]|jgi:hypothetical protein|nr:DUF4328 domain-containing protein [Akkermansiaceae bacterium]